VRDDVDRVTFDLVGPATIVFQARSFEPIGIAFDGFFLALVAHSFAQFARVVLEVRVDACQFPAEKELLSLLDFGEFRGQFAAESANDPIR
jgi:hypothetical protein